MDIFTCILVEDYWPLGRVTEHARGVVWEVGDQDIFLKFSWVNLRGRLYMDFCLGSLRNSQGPPQDPVNPDEESG